MILDPKGYRQGTKKVVSDHRKMEKELAQAGKGVNGRTKADAQLQEAKEVSKRLYKQGKITLDQARALRRAAVLNHKHSMAKIVDAEKQASEKTLRILKKAKEEKARIVKAEAAVVDRENARLDKKYKAYLANRHAVQRKWNRRRVANEKAAAAKIAALRKSAFAGGMFGTGGIAQGLGKITGGFQKLTSALFPVAIAFYAIGKAVGVAFRGIKAWVRAADTMKKQMIVLTTLMGGNVEMATTLRNSLVEYAKATAFSVEQTMELAVQMKALGFTAQEIPTIMAKLGRLSFGDGAKLKLVAKAYSDVRAQGKLLMTEVRQFANQGVPLLAQLQINLGKTALQVRDDMKNGLIGFEDVKKAIDDIAESYGNVDTAGLQTFTGQMEAASEAWNELLAKTGQSPALVKLGEGLNMAIGLLDTLVGNTNLLDAGFQSLMQSARLALNELTLGLSEAIIWADYLWDTLSGDRAARESIKADLAIMAEQTAELARQKKVYLEATEKAGKMDAYWADRSALEAQRTAEEHKLMYEELAAGEDPENAAWAEGKLQKLEREAALAKEIADSYKKIEEESAAAKDSNEFTPEQQAEHDSWIENQKHWAKKSIEAKHAAQNAKEDRDKAAEEQKKIDEAEAKRKKEQAEQEEEWRKQDIEDAKKMIKLAEEAQAKFVKDQDAANKFKDMGPQTAPSFQANSVAEFTFRKEKELQRDKQREENRREAERREHAEQLNQEVVNAIHGLGLDGADQAELNFQGVGE